MTWLFECDSCGTITIVLSIIIGILGFHYVYFLWNADYWKKKGVFSPNSRALMGNLPGQLTGKKHIMYEIDELYQKYEKQHSYIGIFHFRQPRLLVFDPEIIKMIFINHFKNFQGTEFYGRTSSKDLLFGEHPFFLVGDKWKAKRQEISPAFTSNRIKAIYPVSQEILKKMNNYIKSEIAKPDHSGFDAKDLAARYTISLVSDSIYNVDSNCFDGGESEILKVSRELLAPTGYQMMMMTLSTVYGFVGRWYKMKFIKDSSEKFYIDLMKQAMEFREKNKIKRADYLDHLMNLKAKKEITDLSIAAHGASFLIDGFDTSSSAMSATLYELAKNQEIQDKLREIFYTEMPTDEEFNYDNISNCAYLDQVWNEALRLHSPATYLSRFCNEPITLDKPKEKKVSFDYGDIVLIPVRSINYNPEFHPDPEKFDPDRFSPENGGAKTYIDQAKLITFGIGPRACVGSRFAVEQSKLAIASLIRNYKISLNPKTPEKFIAHPQAIIYTLEGSVLDFKPYIRGE